MKLIRIEVNKHGGHDNWDIVGTMPVPEGCAVIPETMTIPETFPFVDITVKNGVVTSMTVGTMPEMPEETPTQLDMIEAQVTYTAMMTDTLLGV